MKIFTDYAYYYNKDSRNDFDSKDKIIFAMLDQLIENKCIIPT